MPTITLTNDKDGSQPGEAKGTYRLRTFEYVRGAGEDGLIVIDPTPAADVGKGVMDLRGATGLCVSLKNRSGGSRIIVTPPTPSVSLIKDPGVVVAVGDGQDLTTIGNPQGGWPASLGDGKEEWRNYNVGAVCGLGVLWVEFESEVGAAATWDMSVMALWD